MIMKKHAMTMMTTMTTMMMRMASVILVTILTMMAKKMQLTCHLLHWKSCRRTGLCGISTDAQNDPTPLPRFVEESRCDYDDRVLDTLRICNPEGPHILPLWN